MPHQVLGSTRFFSLFSGKALGLGLGVLLAWPAAALTPAGHGSPSLDRPPSDKKKTVELPPKRLSREETHSGPIESLAPATTGTVIENVAVTGNRRIEKDAILEKMTLKAGSKISPEAVRNDILSIFEMGFFEDVRMDLTGRTLTVEVRERPLVSEIAFEGAEEFEKKDLDEASGLKPFTVLNLTKIRSAQQAIAKKYEEKGYYLAQADYALQPIPNHPAEVKLVFKITENERVRIRRIFFSGNKNFTAGDLKQVMVTSEGHVFSWMTSGGTYRSDAFDRDLAVLAYFYGNEGFIQAKFAKPRVSLSQDRRYIDIFIDVDEGRRFNLGNVSFKGDLIFPEDELRRSFKMSEGDVFSAGKLQEEILKLTDKYGDQGYAFANVIPRPQIRENTDVVDLNFDIEKGEKVYWGKISISGNTKTHDKVIRRELPFHEGELYNATKRKKGLEKVRRLGFFGNDVNFLTSSPKGTTNVLDLEIKVAEKPTGTLNVSAGFGTNSGFTLMGQVSQNNFLGLGQQLTFNLQWSKGGTTTGTERQFTLAFTDPKAFDTDWLMGGDIYYQESQVGANPFTYRQQLTGFNLRIGRDIEESWNLYGTYKLQNSRLTDPINPAIFTDPAKDRNSLISSVTATLAYDTRNNRLDPSGGEYFSGSSEFAGLGGRVFQKYLLTARLYRRLFWKLVFRSNFEYGLLTNMFQNETVPDAERFVLGGIFSLRGYPAFSVGPGKTVTNVRDPVGSGGGTTFPYVVGGTTKLVLNEELEFPLIPEADIRAALFFDAGNAWDSLNARSPALYSNYGWGIRWYSPLGPLRFEFGYPLQVLPSKGNKGYEFQFIIAPTF